MSNKLLKGIAYIELDDTIGVVDAYILFDTEHNMTKKAYQLPEELYHTINKELGNTLNKLSNSTKNNNMSNYGFWE
jgi:hypothetical protein